MGGQHAFFTFILPPTALLFVQPWIRIRKRKEGASPILFPIRTKGWVNKVTLLRTGYALFAGGSLEEI